jgi:hypothetical protein
MKPDPNNANVPGLAQPSLQTAELLVSNVAVGNETSRKYRTLVNGPVPSHRAASTFHRLPCAAPKLHA